jgi:hypothetical protein
MAYTILDKLTLASRLPLSREAVVPSADGQLTQSGRTRPGRNRGGVLPWGGAWGTYFWMLMVSLSVSFPQTEKFWLQPKMSAVATAVPCLKVLPKPDTWTRTRIC